MFNPEKILELIKLSTKQVATLALAGLAILFLPSDVLAKFGLNAIDQSWRVVIGFITLVSICFLFISLIPLFLNGIKNWIIGYRLRQRALCHLRLNTIKMGELFILTGQKNKNQKMFMRMYDDAMAALQEKNLLIVMKQIGFECECIIPNFVWYSRELKERVIQLDEAKQGKS